MVRAAFAFGAWGRSGCAPTPQTLPRRRQESPTSLRAGLLVVLSPVRRYCGASQAPSTHTPMAAIPGEHTVPSWNPVQSSTNRRQRPSSHRPKKKAPCIPGASLAQTVPSATREQSNKRQPPSRHKPGEPSTVHAVRSSTPVQGPDVSLQPTTPNTSTHTKPMKYCMTPPGRLMDNVGSPDLVSLYAILCLIRPCRGCATIAWKVSRKHSDSQRSAPKRAAFGLRFLVGRSPRVAGFTVG